MSETARGQIFGVTDLSRLPLGVSQRLMSVPEMFQQPSPQTTEARAIAIQGSTELSHPETDRRFTMVPHIVRVLNACMNLPVSSREESFQARDINTYGVDEDEVRLGITRNYLSSTALKRSINSLEHLGQQEFKVPIIERIPTSSNHTGRDSGSGVRVRYRINPRIYFIDKRVT